MNHVSASSLLPLTGVALTAVLACARAPSTPAPAAPSRLECPTGYSVRVSNGTPDAVEVWQHTTAGGEKGEYVDTVEPHSSRDLALRDNGGVWWVWAPAPPHVYASSEVPLFMHCR